MIYSQWYYSKYQSPNIIIVPTEELPLEKAKVDIDYQVLQNTENKSQDSFRNLISIPLTNISEQQCSNSNIGKSDCQSNNAKPIWASSSLQAIGQVHAKPLYTQTKTVSFEEATENTNRIPETKSTSIAEENPIIERSNINCSKVGDEELTPFQATPMIELLNMNINKKINEVPFVQEMKCNDNIEDLKPFKNDLTLKFVSVTNDCTNENRNQVVNESKSVCLESILELYKNNTADKSSQTENTFSIPILDKSHNANNGGDIKPFMDGNIAPKLESNECSSKKDRYKFANNKSVSLESVKQIYKNKAEKSNQTAKTYTLHEHNPYRHHSEAISKHPKSSYYADKLSKHCYNRYKSEFKTNHLDSKGTYKTGSKIRLPSSSKISSSYMNHRTTKKYNHRTTSKHTSMRQTDHNLISPIGSVVLQISNSNPSPPSSAMIGIHKTMDLRNKLLRKKNERATPRKIDKYWIDKYRTKKNDNSNISVNNTNNTNLETNTNGGKQVVKEINFVINIILEKEEHSKNDCKDSTNNHVDLSFLDDFNIDDIVESLNYSEKTQCDNNINNSHRIDTNNVIKTNERNKSSFKTEISKQSAPSKADNIIKQAEHLLSDYRLKSDPIKAVSDDAIINTTDKTDVPLNKKWSNKKL